MTLSQEVLAVAGAAMRTERRIRPHAIETPCLQSRVDCGLVFKAENLQRTGSFKIRGALAKLSTLPRSATVITPARVDDRCKRR